MVSRRKRRASVAIQTSNNRCANTATDAESSKSRQYLSMSNGRLAGGSSFSPMAAMTLVHRASTDECTGNTIGLNKAFSWAVHSFHCSIGKESMAEK